MKITKITPLATTKDIQSIKTFYTKHFNFKITFDNESFLELKTETEPHSAIAFMLQCADSEEVFNGKGLSLCLEVDDVDSEYKRLVAEGVAPVAPPKDNSWGDRSFIVVDPAGIALYIHKLIPPSAEFAKFYKE